MNDSMIIIGISCFYHDAGIAIIENGKILFAAQEERYTRKKNDESFPVNALRQGLASCNIAIQDIHTVVYYEKPFLKFERIILSYLDTAPNGFSSFINAMHTWTHAKLFIKQDIFKAFKRIDSSFRRENIRLLFTEHHVSHAASAFYPSSFEEAAILTIDGVGEYATTTLAYGNGSSITLLKEIHFPHSIGLLYSAVTYFLGFKVNSDEYKVMGLAAYGNPEHKETKAFSDIIEHTLIRLFCDGSFELQMTQFAFREKLAMVDDRKWERLFNLPKRAPADELTQSHCNLAYAFQKVTEKAVMQLCSHIKDMTGSENLCLAGGVALNSVINGIIKDSGIFKNIFIQPAAGDAGGALGAGLAAHHIYYKHKRELTVPDAMQNGLLGNSFNDGEIKSILETHGKYVFCKDENELCSKTAQLIADGNVTGWFQGKMEFGPRALGNRSIIADARNPDMQSRLNMKIKKRESFRPFAPAVLEEDAADYFHMEGTSPYMLQVHKIRREILKDIPPEYPDYSILDKLHFNKSAIPAVTHVDFTARIQTVNPKEHPLFYKLIRSFKNITGCSLIINTSFNIKDEPIVCTPADAYRCFINTGMDVLVIGSYIISK